MSLPVDKLKVAILYGGRSCENQISVISAKSIYKNFSSEKFITVPVYISLEGEISIGEDFIADIQELDPVKAADTKQIVSLLKGSSFGSYVDFLKDNINVVFPIIHGQMGEDGVIQGFCQMLNLPYVGPSIKASANGFDKDLTKQIAKEAGVPVAPYRTLFESEWRANRENIIKELLAEFEIPVFVKPAEMGSSIAVSKVKDKADLPKAIDEAFEYDNKVLIETFIKIREIEVAVLGSGDGNDIASVPGEVKPHREYYDYIAKYLDPDGASFDIPANMPAAKIQEAQEVAKKVFKALECSGLTRVDLFYSEEHNKLYLNEVNTLPGFTSISLYPTLMNASGISYSQLLEKLVNLAIDRHNHLHKTKFAPEVVVAVKKNSAKANSEVE